MNHPTDKGTQLLSRQLLTVLYKVEETTDSEYETDNEFWAHEEEVKEAVNLASGVDTDYTKMYNAIGALLNDRNWNTMLSTIDPKLFEQLRDAWPQKS
jgi:3-methyladenine DNA glycosylase/8-oxoguanine DNA glycosylase